MRYLRHVFRHKVLVFVECIRLGLPLWTALVHDWDKFLPDEWFAHARAFNGRKYADTGEFMYASNRHQKRNPHHWQYFILARDRGDEIVLEMPQAARREMVADWRAVARANGTDLRDWYEDNRAKIRLGPLTRMWTERDLGEGNRDGSVVGGRSGLVAQAEPVAGLRDGEAGERGGCGHIQGPVWP